MNKYGNVVIYAVNLPCHGLLTNMECYNLRHQIYRIIDHYMSKYGSDYNARQSIRKFSDFYP